MLGCRSGEGPSLFPGAHVKAKLTHTKGIGVSFLGLHIFSNIFNIFTYFQEYVNRGMCLHLYLYTHMSIYPHTFRNRLPTSFGKGGGSVEDSDARLENSDFSL